MSFTAVEIDDPELTQQVDSPRSHRPTSDTPRERTSRPRQRTIDIIGCGQPYRHVMGFKAAHHSPCRESAGDTTALRRGESPLIG
ncbi:hypothetical protein AXA44_44375 [Rhodococcus sp. SC4]|nr:hypothetical protein AXA44_44375 [Rhodococcus sp. SC4]